MDMTLKRRFLERWSKYFPGAELPITFYYMDEETAAPPPPSREGFHCLICELAAVRKGMPRHFDVHNTRCGGARRYLGFDTRLRPTFPYFLSCGIPGEIKGERYKQSPELVEAYLETQPTFEAPASTVVFKRWDDLQEQDEPAVVVFFAPADVLSGLFTLANFDEVDPDAVIAPFGSGCSSIVYHPYRELDSQRPRAVLGMFDVSARPCVDPDVLSFAVPWPKFVRMVGHMDQSFLITRSWHQVRSRMQTT
ncbi:MAG: DUF169 domain-containing protein [Anaerolineae bacterium]|jgi:hypothetical protein